MTDDQNGGGVTVTYPSPPGLHDKGVIKQTIRALRDDPLNFFLNLSRDYGDVSQFRTGFWPAYLVNHPDYVQQVLRDGRETYSKETFAYTMTTEIFGESSLFITQGEFWRRIRRLVQPAFHKERITNIGGLVTARTQKAIEHHREDIGAGRIFDIEEMMMLITVEVVAEALFGVDVSDQAKTVVDAVTVANVSMRPGFPKMHDTALKDAIGVLDEAMYGIIARRRAQGVDTGDMLSMLMYAKDADTGEPLTDSQIRDQILTFLIPAEETTSTALAWTWYVLGQREDVQNQLRAELRSVVGNRAPTVDDLPKLQYTRQVFQETMRLYPPIWIMSRKATEDDVIGGYHIPAGAFVALSPYTMHRHPGYWAKPETFDPAHFSPEAVALRPNYAYYPFGGGMRGCIGEQFAMTESLLILAMIAKDYHVELDADHVVGFDPVYTLRPTNGVRVKLTRV